MSPLHSPETGAAERSISPSLGMGWPQVLRSNRDSLAVFAAIRRASAAYRRPSLSGFEGRVIWQCCGRLAKRRAWVDRSVADPKRAMLVLFADHHPARELLTRFETGQHFQSVPGVPMKFSRGLSWVAYRRKILPGACSDHCSPSLAKLSSTVP
jgi:hypothetical protein